MARVERSQYRGHRLQLVYLLDGQTAGEVLQFVQGGNVDDHVPGGGLVVIAIVAGSVGGAFVIVYVAGVVVRQKGGGFLVFIRQN